MHLGLYADISNVDLLPIGSFDFLEENVQTLLVPESVESVFAERLHLVEEAGIPVYAANRYLPADLRITGPEVDEARLIRWAEVAMERAERAGVRIMVWGSGASRRLPDGWTYEQGHAQFVRAVTLTAPIAERHGVTLVIEPLSRGDSNFILSLAEGASIVEAVGHPSVRLLADIYHMLVEGESPAELTRWAPMLEHVHVAERAERGEPGRHEEDFRPWLEALHTGGYEKAVVIEAEWQDLAAESRSGLACLAGQMREVGWS